MGHWLKSACVAACFIGVAHSAAAGIVVGGTRVVYEGAKKEASIAVNNPEKTTPYLVQSWVELATIKEHEKAPFLITPPLFRLDAGQENVLRIIRTGGDFPKDKESVFWINIKSIPASEQTDTNQLLIAVKTRIKMFYRPPGLSGKPAEAYKALTFSRQGDQLQVSNPPSYHVSFFSVKIGSKDIKEPSMVATGGTASWPVPPGATGAVSWEAINDYGGITATATAPQ